MTMMIDDDDADGDAGGDVNVDYYESAGNDADHIEDIDDEENDNNDDDEDNGHL